MYFFLTNCFCGKKGVYREDSAISNATLVYNFETKPLQQFDKYGSFTISSLYCLPSALFVEVGFKSFPILAFNSKLFSVSPESFPHYFQPQNICTTRPVNSRENLARF